MTKKQTSLNFPVLLIGAIFVKKCEEKLKNFHIAIGALISKKKMEVMKSNIGI